MPFELKEVINRLKGKIATFDVFDTNPSNPENMTDEKWDTECAEGKKTISAPGSVGYIIFDMGAPYPVLVCVLMNIHKYSGDGSLYAQIDTSDDGVNWNWAAASIMSGVTSDGYRSAAAVFLYARYFRVRIASSGTSVASEYHVKVKQVMALQLR